MDVDVVDSLGLIELFDELIISPLVAITQDATMRRTKDPALRQETVHDPLVDSASGMKRMVVLIDALDEIEPKGRNLFLKLLRTKWDQVPSWLGLMVTSRPSSGTGQANDLLEALSE